MTLGQLVIQILMQMSESSEKEVTSAVKNLRSKLTKLLSAIGITLSLKNINELLEQWNEVNKVVNNLNTELEDQYELQDMICEAANNTRMAYTDMANYVSDLVRTGSSYFSTGEDAAEFLEIANQLFEVAGATDSEISSLNSVIKNTFTNGTVSASGFSTIISACPELVDYLAESLDKSTEAIKAMGYGGTITASMLYKAFVDNADSISDAYEGLSLTISDATTIIKNKWGTWLSQMDQTYKLTDTIARLMVSAFDKVMVVLEKITAAFNTLADVLGSTEAAAKVFLGTMVALMAVFNASKIQNTYKALKDFGTLLTGLGSKMSVFTTALKSGASFGEVFSTAIKSIGSSLGNLKIVAIIAAIAAVILVIRDLIKFANGEDSVTGSLFEKLGIDGERLREAIQNLMSAFSSLFSMIMPVIQNLIDTILPIFESWIQSCSDILAELIQVIVDVLAVILEVATSLLEICIPIIETLLELLEPVIDIIGVLLEAIGAVIEIVAELLKPILQLIDVLAQVLYEFLEPITDVIGVLADLLTGNLSESFSFISDIIDGVINGSLKPLVDFLKYIADFLSVVFSGDWEEAWKALGNIVISIVNGMIASFESFLNFFVDAINSITSNLSSLWTWLGIPEIPQLSQVSFSRIAYLAEGGYVEANHPTPVVIGDNTQEGEIVSPISKMRETVLDALQSYLPATNTEIDTSSVTAAITEAGQTVANGLTQVVSAISSMPVSQTVTTESNVTPIVTVLAQILAVMQTIANNFATVTVNDNAGSSVTLTSAEVRSIVNDGVAYLASSLNLTGTQTGAQTLESQVSNMTINQSVYMYNTFQGTKDVQKQTSDAMKTSATDIAQALADAINYTR